MSVPGLDEAVSTASANAADVDARARFPRETVEVLGATGLLGLTVPQRLGGRGKGPVEAFEVISAIAEQCGSSGMILTMHLSALAVLLRAGDGRFDAVLREAAAGRHLSTLALSERATRSNFWVSMGHAERSAGGYRVCVDKSFVTSAGPAHSYVVTTATPDRSSQADTEMFLVLSGNGGVEVQDWWQGSGLRGNASAPVRFDCFVPDSAHIGGPAGGRAVLWETVMPWFQLGIASVSVGLARAAASITREHVRNTSLEHLGERLADQPVVRHGLGRLQAGADMLTGFVRSVAGAMATGTAGMTQILELKVVANEAALAATDQAMRLGGGAAYSGRSPVDRIFRDSRAGIVMAPTADMLYDMIGRVVLGQPPV